MFQQKNRIVCSVILVLTILTLNVHSQDNPGIKFGKVTANDLKQKIYPVDSSANAVVIADVASAIYDGGNNGFEVVFKRECRIHILNKNGFDESTIEVLFYKGDTEYEKVLNIRGTTYNLEGGKVVTTKLDNDQVFTDKYNKNYMVKKFTLPAVKEGSIIEFSYTIRSPYWNEIPSWSFQKASVPTLWSEYNVMIPQYFEFTFLTQGYFPFHLRDSKNGRKMFLLRDTRGAGASDTYRADAGITEYRFVMKDLPALKVESFTTTPMNHISQISFQFSGTRWPNEGFKPVRTTYNSLMESLLKSDYYGADLSKGNNYLEDQLKELTWNAKDNLEKAKNIYKYVRDNYTCTSHSDLYIDRSLKEIFRSKNGTVTELNLLLVAMLQKAGFFSNPVLLSTRAHGRTYELYPIVDKFNYTIAELKLDSNYYYLDASYDQLGFNKLPPEVYNGHARIVSEGAEPLDFDPNKLLQQKLTNLFIVIGNDGAIKGSLQQIPSYFESLKLRQNSKKDGTESIEKIYKKAISEKASLTKFKLDRLQQLDQPLSVSFDFSEPGEGGDIIYLNPMFGESYKSNPFKSEKRFYPVEMDYAIDENYTINITIPEGYEIEEVPKSTIVKLNEADGVFQYLLQKGDNYIQMRSRIKLNKANFAREDYASLRQFFDVIVKKHAEQIVFKKKEGAVAGSM
ncbi:hypothetical protein COR50_13790 [Chitinophaga caeni]|uniref:DUF3857 domain-containing protein n=1 Tax=Chitinophaga caeni TaxID=2029983 RepID=A0A291QW05_9BACT|nr:DUF3857 domain-containing protein [Chitinophaga caeni]ATL48148.1 hypothetical protein COR50_13790 [Chitinophaga caeni]